MDHPGGRLKESLGVQSGKKSGELTMDFDTWQPQSPAPRPAATAHVWWLDLADIPERAWTDWLAVLDAEERQRAARFIPEADRRSFVAAHALLRGMLLRFASIGVDIENEDRAGFHLDIAEAYFAPAEVAFLQAAPPAERQNLFFRLWTLKEAYIKACGQGLSMALDQFAMSLTPPKIRFQSEASDNPARWWFETMACTARHRLSVAIRSETEVAIKPRRISFSEIERLLGFPCSVEAHS